MLIFCTVSDPNIKTVIRLYTERKKFSNILWEFTV